MTTPISRVRSVPAARDLLALDAAAYRPSRAMTVLMRLLRELRAGNLTVVLPNGDERHYGGVEAGPDATLVVHDDRVARRFLFGGRLGFCEAYLDGDWSSPDVGRFFELILRNEAMMADLLAGRPWARLIAYLGRLARLNTRRGSKRNIAYHYDLGNAFYEAWLDPTMTYSSAVFAEEASEPLAHVESEGLADAQLRKYRLLAERLDLSPGHHVLEIGCGWGGFAEFVATRYDVRVTAITISQEQYAYARDRMVRAGIADRVEVVLTDYRDVTGRFDRIASIEMFEAVGEAFWPGFFQVVRDRLKPGGRAALQVITIENHRFRSYRRGGDYIQKYIFPGGMLPSIEALQSVISRTGLDWLGHDGYGRHYARTLRLWDQDFQEAWGRLEGLGFDRRFKRMWEQYLQYCAAGFTSGAIDVIQLSIGRE